MRKARLILVFAGSVLVAGSAVAQTSAISVKDLCTSLPSTAQLPACSGKSDSPSKSVKHEFDAQVKSATGDRKMQLKELERYQSALGEVEYALTQAAAHKGAGDWAVLQLGKHDLTINRGTQPVIISSVREDWTAGARLTADSPVWLWQYLQGKGLKVTVEKRLRQEKSIHSWWYDEYWALVVSWS
ncbi:MAG TPA: hypothetical protein V6C81_13265 [Planktothrix sp.]|jgi:hypothetical protein